LGIVARQTAGEGNILTNDAGNAGNQLAAIDV
jgi:hypothetical protein